MPTTYNEMAGRSVERLAALSDGVFAVAMTLLGLDLRAPDEQPGALGPRLPVYLMTSMTLGIFWVGQRSQLNNQARSVSWVCAIGMSLVKSDLPRDFPAAIERRVVIAFIALVQLNYTLGLRLPRRVRH